MHAPVATASVATHRGPTAIGSLRNLGSTFVWKTIQNPLRFVNARTSGNSFSCYAPGSEGRLPASRLRSVGWSGSCVQASRERRANTGEWGLVRLRCWVRGGGIEAPSNAAHSTNMSRVQAEYGDEGERRREWVEGMGVSAGQWRRHNR